MESVMGSNCERNPWFPTTSIFPSAIPNEWTSGAIIFLVSVKIRPCFLSSDTRTEGVEVEERETISCLVEVEIFAGFCISNIFRSSVTTSSSTITALDQARYPVFSMRKRYVPLLMPVRNAPPEISEVSLRKSLLRKMDKRGRRDLIKIPPVFSTEREEKLKV